MFDRCSIWIPVLAIVVAAGGCLGWSSNTRPNIQRQRTRLWYQHEEDHSPERQLTESHQMNTAFLDPHRDELLQWLNALESVERSQPLWVGTDLLHLSPSEVLQSRLDSFPGLEASCNLFPHIPQKGKFDWDWRYALVKLFCQEGEWKARNNWKQGMSNFHPLRLQLVAIPPHTSLPPHVHPASELDIPLLGTLYEERTSLMVDPDLIDRAPEHSLGTPLSDFSPQPTPEELKAIHRDLTERVSEEHRLEELEDDWETNVITAGESLVNTIGSVHRSFTKDEPCLLFVLGPNVHAHFKE